MKSLRIIAVFILFFAGTIVGNAQTTADSSIYLKGKKPTIVFVHGLWADGSCWNSVIESLQAEGYEVVSAQNPTTSLEDDIAATKKALDRAQGPVILVGHSWGGFVITEAGTDPRVEALVYVAAFAPDANENSMNLLAMSAPNDLTKYFQVNNGFITLTKEGIKNVFAADLPAKKQLALYATQTPAAQIVFGAKNTFPAWKTKPSWYIVAKQDKAINPDLERMMAKRINAKTIEVESSHVVMLAKPMEVLKMIHEAIAYKY